MQEFYGVRLSRLSLKSLGWESALRDSGASISGSVGKMEVEVRYDKTQLPFFFRKKKESHVAVIECGLGAIICCFLHCLLKCIALHHGERI